MGLREIPSATLDRHLVICSVPALCNAILVRGNSGHTHDSGQRTDCRRCTKTTLDTRALLAFDKNIPGTVVGTCLLTVRGKLEYSPYACLRNALSAVTGTGVRSEDSLRPPLPPPPLTFLDVPYYEGEGACDEKHRLDVYIPSAPFPRTRSRTCLFVHGG